MGHTARTTARRGLSGVLATAAVAVGMVAAATPAAAVGTAVGFGACATGGGGLGPITVSTPAALITAMRSGEAAVIRVNGMITLSGMQDVGSSKTIIGVGSNSGIAGGGLDVDGATNVIIQNLNFRGRTDDAVTIQRGSRCVWVDHNTFVADGDGTDGAVDIERASDLVTVSWNRFTGHERTSQVGHSDANAAEDRGRLRVSYHHNWFQGTDQANPRVRFGHPVHVFNNYFDQLGSYGVASTTEAGVLVEGNYFEGIPEPFRRGEGTSPAGALVARGNHFVDSGAGQQGGFVQTITYHYVLDAAFAVEAIVRDGAGVGRLP